MSYDIVKAGLVGILNGQGYLEASDAVSFENVSVQEYETSFILACKQGEADEPNDTQSSFLYDKQEWTVQVAFGHSGESSASQIDRINRAKDTLLIKLDNPSSWNTFCTLLRYTSWQVEDIGSYYLLTISLKIIDMLPY